MLVYFALGDAKVWRWGSKPTPGPNANGFASQWNIGCRSPPSDIPLVYKLFYTFVNIALIALNVILLWLLRVKVGLQTGSGGGGGGWRLLPGISIHPIDPPFSTLVLHVGLPRGSFGLPDHRCSVVLTPIDFTISLLQML